MKIMVPPCNRWSCSSSSVPSSPKGIAGRKRGRPCSTNAARERSRVRTLRLAFLELQNTLPAVPPDTKLSKLDVLVLATTYISHLLRTLNDNRHPEAMTQRDEGSGTWLTETGSGERERSIPRFKPDGLFRPVKKWPMRSRLYASIFSSTDATTNGNTNNRFSQDSTNIAPAVPQTTW